MRGAMARDLRPAVLAPLLLAGAATALAPHPEPDSAAATPTARVGPFTLRALLGAGAMGAVWLAEQDAPLVRQVALKVVPYREVDHSAARYRAERDALASVSHHNIAHLLDAGTHGELGWLALELVPGEPITDYSDARGLSPTRRVELFTQACDAVQHLHERGYLHRDLKPHNILVTERNGVPELKLVDLGLARRIDQRGGSGEAAIVGTLGYMAPEQLLRPAEVDQRSDVFGLGAVLHELLSGRSPIDAVELTQARRDDDGLQLRQAPVVPPSRAVAGDEIAAARRGTNSRALGRWLARTLDKVVVAALSPDPAARPASAAALRNAVRASLRAPSRWQRLVGAMRRTLRQSRAG